MPHYGTLHDFSFGKDIDDIRGSALYGVDNDKLGKIDDIIFDHATGEIKYAVVDSGGWFTHKRFLVPADRIHAYDKDKDAFQIDLLKEHIERKFPRYDDNALKSDKDWTDYESNYKRNWEADPVQHRDDRVDLDVTPATVNTASAGPGVPMGSLGEEVGEPNPNFDRDQEALSRAATPTRLAGKFPETIQSGEKLTMGPANVPGRSYDQARVGSERNPDRAWQDNATGSGGHENTVGSNLNATSAPTLNNEYPVETNPPANPTQQQSKSLTDRPHAEVGQWHPRMKKFEDVLKKNRVDVTASCSSCKPARDKVA